jgi:leucyl/phenylalanyl-tRNA---protein transferase
MPIAEFPDPRDADDNGIVAIGGDLHPDSLRLAYGSGIFPWPHQGLPLLWFSPPQRAILQFDRLHVPSRLARLRRQCGLTFTIDRVFQDVIRACGATPRPGQRGTWITRAMIAGYTAAHQQGFVHSVEAWNGDGELVGGLYGVDCSGVFAGESMFYRTPSASKLALLHLIDHLAGRGATWIDIQTMTPHFEVLGAGEIPREEYLGRLKSAQEVGLRLFD